MPKIPRYSYDQACSFTFSTFPSHPFIVYDFPQKARNDLSHEELKKLFSKTPFWIFVDKHENNQENSNDNEKDTKGNTNHSNTVKRAKPQIHPLMRTNVPIGTEPKAWDFFIYGGDYVDAFFSGDTSLPNIFQQNIEGEARDAYQIPECMEKQNILCQAKKEAREGSLCLVLSPSKAYTGLHWDSYGFGGWMYLTKGVKRWELVDPMNLMALYDPHTQKLWDNRSHPHPNSEYAKFLDTIPKYEGTLSDHELLFFPGGWAHRVFTDELSYGCGGSVLKTCDTINSVNIYSLEKALNCDAREEFDYFSDILVTGFIEIDKERKNKTGKLREFKGNNKEEKKEETKQEVKNHDDIVTKVNQTQKNEKKKSD